MEFKFASFSEFIETMYRGKRGHISVQWEEVFDNARMVSRESFWVLHRALLWGVLSL